MRKSGGGYIYTYIYFTSIHFSGARGVVCCSRLVSCWMLMKFNSLNLVRMTWIFVSNIGYVNWRVVFIGGVGVLWTTNLGGR